MIQVSAHAIIRWLERVENFDFSATRSRLSAAGRKPTDLAVVSDLISRGDAEVVRIARAALTRPHVGTMHALGFGRVPLGNGYAAVVTDHTVITVVPAAKAKATRRRRRRRRPGDFRELEIGEWADGRCIEMEEATS